MSTPFFFPFPFLFLYPVLASHRMHSHLIPSVIGVASESTWGSLLCRCYPHLTFAEVRCSSGHQNSNFCCSPSHLHLSYRAKPLS